MIVPLHDHHDVIIVMSYNLGLLGDVLYMRHSTLIFQILYCASPIVIVL